MLSHQLILLLLLGKKQKPIQTFLLTNLLKLEKEGLYSGSYQVKKDFWLAWFGNEVKEIKVECCCGEFQKVKIVICLF